MSKTVYIVGAGLSSYAGLPLQEQFTNEILAARAFESGPSRALVRHLDEFVREVFHQKRTADAAKWPQLEDIFTFIDLSANTGHHLGPSYSPKDLRRMRRVLIARTIRMLARSYEKAKKRADEQWKRLVHFAGGLDIETSRFISLNWDTSLEAILTATYPRSRLSYGLRILSARLLDGGEVEVLTPGEETEIRIAKMHGSINWLYCDNCRRVFWFEPAQSVNVADQIVREEEWELIRPNAQPRTVWHCPYCPAVVLSTRIATFSYQKALDFPMFQRSWMRAEENLRASDRWVFIGYSLPAADFEFKYLLKRVELARRRRPFIVTVSGGSDAATDSALRNYEGLFGSLIKDGETFYRQGLTPEIVEQITGVWEK